MRKRLKSFTIAAFAAAFLAAPAMPALAAAAPEVGKTAPDFTGVDSNGASVTLSALRGKLVVLEWTNDGCPFVGKHYGAGNMQKTQKMARAMGAVWLSIVSSAPGTQGHVDGAGANRLTETRDAAPNHVILDPKGVIGRRYEATNTPQMFVDRQGRAGALHGRDRQHPLGQSRRYPAGEELCDGGAERDRRRPQGERAGRPAPTAVR